MNGYFFLGVAAMGAMLALAPPVAHGQAADPRLREVVYDPGAVLTVPVKRGVVTHVVFDADEAIAEVAAGLGGDCAKAESAWCIAAQPGGRHLFVKAKSLANAPNNLAVVTDRRTHSFRFVVLADSDPKAPTYRLEMKARPVRAAAPAGTTLHHLLPLLALPLAPPAPASHEMVAERLQAKPQVMNTNYSMAEGAGSQDIVPALVFDDGRFTYLRSDAAELPALYELKDGQPSLVDFQVKNGVYVVPKVVERGYLALGKARFSFQQER